MYLGSPGNLIQIPDPLPGVKMTADRGGSTHTTLQGGQRVDYPGKHPRTYSLSWTDLNDDDYALLEKAYLRQFGPGPFILLPDPARWNYLTGEQTSGSETGSVLAVTPSSGIVTSDTTQFHSGTRAYKWATTNINGATFVNNAPNNAFPLGFATPPSVNWCFSAWAYIDTASQTIIPQINWFTSTGAYISTSGTNYTPAANTWTQIYVGDTAPATAAYGVTQFSHATAAAVNIWIDEQQLELRRINPGTPLAGRGQPLVSFTELTEQYDWAMYGTTGKHSVDGTFVEVS